MNPEIMALTQRIQELEAKLNLFMKSDKYLWDKNMQVLDGRTIQIGRTTGLQIGTETDQKIGFLGVAPVGRYNIPFPVTAADLYTALTAFGLTYHA